MNYLIPTIGSLILAGCVSTTPLPDEPCPIRPELTPIPVELQLQMPTEAVQIVADNQIKLKHHILRLEVRLGCEQ